MPSWKVTSAVVSGVPEPSTSRAFLMTVFLLLMASLLLVLLLLLVRLTVVERSCLGDCGVRLGVVWCGEWENPDGLLLKFHRGFHTVFANTLMSVRHISRTGKPRRSSVEVPSGFSHRSRQYISECTQTKQRRHLIGAASDYSACPHLPKVSELYTSMRFVLDVEPQRGVEPPPSRWQGRRPTVRPLQQHANDV